MGLTGRQEAHMESLECLSMNFLNLQRKEKETERLA